MPGTLAAIWVKWSKAGHSNTYESPGAMATIALDGWGNAGRSIVPETSWAPWSQTRLDKFGVGYDQDFRFSLTLRASDPRRDHARGLGYGFGNHEDWVSQIEEIFIPKGTRLINPFELPFKVSVIPEPEVSAQPGVGFVGLVLVAVRLRRRRAE